MSRNNTNATNSKGAPTLESAKAYMKQVENSRVAPYTFQDYRLPNNAELAAAGGGADDHGPAFKQVNSMRYPQRPLPFMPEKDTEIALINDLTSAGGHDGSIPPYISAARPLPVQDWELEYFKSKAAAEDYAAYQNWLSMRYDLNDMATRAWFKQIAPEYFSQKRELLKELMDRHAKYSLLRLAGPESEEDLRFEYLVETGRIPIPKGPFFDPYVWAENEIPSFVVNDNTSVGNEERMKAISEYNAKNYKYGLFNPFKPVSAAEAGWPSNINNPSDIVGVQDSNYYGPLGTDSGSSRSWNVVYGGKNLIDGRNPAVTKVINERNAQKVSNGGVAGVSLSDRSAGKVFNGTTWTKPTNASQGPFNRFWAPF